MLRAVIFDMDGVIIDSEPIYYRVEAELFKSLGLNISEEEHATFVGTTSAGMWSHIGEKYKLAVDVSELVEAESREYNRRLRLQKDMAPVVGIPELLQSLYERNIKTALASSSQMREIVTVLQLFGLKHYFDTVVSGDQMKRGKPAPDIFIAAAGNLGVSPGECIVIEDSKNGVEAAKAAGMKCIGFQNTNSGNQDLSKADLIVDSILRIDINLLNEMFK